MKKIATHLCFFLCMQFGLTMPALAQTAADAVQPETAAQTGSFDDFKDLAGSIKAKQDGKPVSADNWMVSAANPYAVRAGAEILRQGGSAADAMVAVQTVLGLVEPQSSGLGGGAFLVWYDAASGKITTLDGRETAPLAAKPTLFQDDNGEPLKFFDAVVGGLSVGTPGTPMLLEQAHKRWGKKPWDMLLAPATELAENGFTVSPRLAGLIADDRERLSTSAATAAYFLPGGEPLKAGTVKTNPAYAQTLRAIAKDGVGAIYNGPIGDAIVAAVTGADNSGVLSKADLGIYAVKERAAVCADYRGFDVCGMGPPSSGALTVGQILKLIEPTDIAALGPDDPQTWRIIGDASRLAFADRGRYMADSDFVPVPVKGLLDDGYLQSRAALLSGDKKLETVAAGEPEFDHAFLKWADDIAIELPSTSHISIVDAAGNALSMTTTIENGFGSRVMAAGFLLNNELTDFSFRSHKDGVPIANRVEPGKRPRSSMSPTIILKDGKPVLVIGSPGGSRIIGYVAQAIIAFVDWKMNLQEALAMPHRVNRFGTYDLEAETDATTLQPALEALGYEVNVRDLNSGLHAIAIEGDSLLGAADPRREGLAYGE